MFAQKHNEIMQQSMQGDKLLPEYSKYYHHAEVDREENCETDQIYKNTIANKQSILKLLKDHNIKISDLVPDVSSLESPLKHFARADPSASEEKLERWLADRKHPLLKSISKHTPALFPKAKPSLK